MLVTYIVTVYNKEKFIANVIDSLKNIKGNFRKEFIIIDDGSTDQSLDIIKKHSTSLAKVTIISQNNHGPALATNTALKLSNGDYVHFVDGDDIISDEATSLLIKACKDLRTEVAYGLRGKFEHDNMVPNKRETGEVVLIDNPLKEIIEGKIPSVRCIGSSGSLVSRALLEKVGGADIGVFVQDLSISLRCAKHSKFALVKKTVSYSPVIYDAGNLSYNKKYEGYNTLKAILNFIEQNQEIASAILVELYRLLYSVSWKINKTNINTSINYLLSKYTKPKIEYQKLVELYKKELLKLL